MILLHEWIADPDNRTAGVQPFPGSKVLADFDLSSDLSPISTLASASHPPEGSREAHIPQQSTSTSTSVTSLPLPISPNTSLPLETHTSCPRSNLPFERSHCSNGHLAELHWGTSPQNLPSSGPPNIPSNNILSYRGPTPNALTLHELCPYYPPSQVTRNPTAYPPDYTYAIDELNCVHTSRTNSVTQMSYLLPSNHCAPSDSIPQSSTHVIYTTKCPTYLDNGTNTENRGCNRPLTIGASWLNVHLRIPAALFWLGI